MVENKFFVIGLPRSRTLWLSKFLTTDKCKVMHDGSCEFVSVEDMLENMPEGNCDTALALKWRELRGKVVVINRDYDEVKEELEKLGLALPCEQLVNAVKEASKVYPSIPFHELKKESVCKWIFEYLTGEKFYRDRWLKMDKEIIMVSIPDEMERFKEKYNNISLFYGAVNHV